MGYRIGKNYQFLSYEEVLQKSHALGSAFINLLGCKTGIIYCIILINKKLQEIQQILQFTLKIVVNGLLLI